MVIQQLDNKRPKLSNLNQTQNRRRYVNLENGWGLQSRMVFSTLLIVESCPDLR